jgi:hypothetical protein
MIKSQIKKNSFKLYPKGGLVMKNSFFTVLITLFAVIILGSSIAQGAEYPTSSYIIQLSQPSMAKFKADQKKPEKLPIKKILAHQRRLDKEYQRFKTDLAAELKTGDLIIARRLDYVINTVTIETTNAIIKKIKRFNYVKRVEENTELIFDDDGVAIINADDVWNVTDPNGKPVTGQGTVVAVIDSGFNYYHEALGGQPIGPGNTVIKGYDFVEDDNDPYSLIYDHGTRVAGVVLAVAPDANLELYRTIYSDQTQAALELILDPDGDPVTDDSIVDVVNLSISSGYGNIEDTTSVAVDNTVEQGIVCTIAAGNEGEAGYFTVTTPASSLKGIAVGNSRYYESITKDFIYDGSSKGPLLSTFHIKPDVCAPGYNIELATGENEYVTSIGTSYSSPHVAGAAALIKQLHPDWTPDMIKAALMETAVDVNNESVFAQGAGRIDAYKAALTKAIILPSSFSLGPCDLDKNTWKTGGTFTITNVSDNNVSYAIGYDSINLVEGITIEFSHNQVILAPGESVDITCKIRVNNATVPNITEPPYAYEGFITATASSGEEHLRVPFAFIKSPLIHITLNAELEGQDSWGWWTKVHNIIIHNSNDFIRELFGYLKNFAVTHNPLIYPLPHDTYDFMTLFADNLSHIHVKEDIAHTNYITYITLDINEAQNEITFVNRDKNNNHVAEDCYVALFKHTELPASFEGNNFYHAYNIYTHPVMSTDFSDDYIFEWSAHRLDDSKDYYFFNGSVQGLSNDYVFENSPDDFKDFKQTFIVNPGMEEIFVVSHIIDGKIYINSFQCQQCTLFGIGGNYDYSKCVLYPPFERNVYLMPQSHPDHQFQYIYSDVYNPIDIQELATVHEGNLSPYEHEKLFRTALFTATSSQDLEAHLGPTKNKQWPSVLYTTQNNDIYSGLTPRYFSGMFINFDQKISLLNSVGAGMFNIFPTQTGDFQYFNNMTLNVYEGDENLGDMLCGYKDYGVSKKASHYDKGVVPKAYYSVPSSGEFIVRAWHPFMLDGISGYCNVTAIMQTAQPEKNSPYIRTFKLTMDNELTQYFVKGKDNKIVFDTYTYGNEYITMGAADNDNSCTNWEYGYAQDPGNLALYYRIGEGEWQELPLSQYGNVFSAQFPDLDYDNKLVSLLIETDNQAGSSLTCEISPAFKFYSPPAVKSTNIPDGATNISIAANIYITFTKPVDTASAENAFAIAPYVPGTFIWYDNDTKMRFKPDIYFEEGTNYKYSLYTTVIDQQGLYMEEPFVAGFTTAVY